MRKLKKRGLLPISSVGRFEDLILFIISSIVFPSITSKGSITFPNDLLIFLFLLSLTIPCRRTRVNGYVPVSLKCNINISDYLFDKNILLFAENQHPGHPKTDYIVSSFHQAEYFFINRLVRPSSNC